MFIEFFLATLVFSLIFTPIAKAVAIKFKIVDYPNTLVKTHKKVTPYLGGAAIALSLIVTLFLGANIFNLHLNNDINVILLCSLSIFLLGFIDDVKSISPLRKISFELLVAVIVAMFGTSISLTHIDFVDKFFSVLWIITLTNAFNLIDIMDGLASGIAIIASISFGIIFVQIHEALLSLLLLGLAGACLGFLKYNFNPAQIFMGDAGSLFIGFLLACTSLYFMNGDQAINLAIIPLLVFGVPLFEIIFVSVLRIKNGRSPLIGSKDHFALRMVKSGLTVKQTIFRAYLFGILLGVISIVSLSFIKVIPFFVITIVLVVIIIAKRLSRVEME